LFSLLAPWGITVDSPLLLFPPRELIRVAFFSHGSGRTDRLSPPFFLDTRGKNFLDDSPPLSFFIKRRHDESGLPFSPPPPPPVWLCRGWHQAFFPPRRSRGDSSFPLSFLPLSSFYLSLFGWLTEATTDSLAFFSLLNWPLSFHFFFEHMEGRSFAVTHDELGCTFLSPFPSPARPSIFDKVNSRFFFFLLLDAECVEYRLMTCFLLSFFSFVSLMRF